MAHLFLHLSDPFSHPADSQSCSQLCNKRSSRFPHSGLDQEERLQLRGGDKGQAPDMDVKKQQKKCVFSSHQGHVLIML